MGCEIGNYRTALFILSSAEVALRQSNFFTKPMTENFVFRKEWREALRGYNAEVRAEVYEAVMAYAFDNEIIEMGELSRMAFNFIKLQIDSMRELYKQKCERNRERANRRWHKNNAEGCDTMPNDAEGCQPMRGDAINSIQLNSNQYISLSFEEREKIFEIFYFERNLAAAKEEYDKFINHYEANGWCRGNSDKPVKSKVALAKSWKVERAEKRYPENIRKWLYGCYLIAREKGLQSWLLFEMERVYFEGDKLVVQCSRQIAELIETVQQQVPRDFSEDLLYRIRREA